MSTPTSIGLPKLQIAFEAAARQTINRSKKGYAAMIVRDAKAQGLHKLSSATMIPTELGEANQAQVRLAFEGSDRGVPSLIYLVVIATGTENTTALEGGLKLLESVSVDYLAAPADVTGEELEVLNEWTKGQRALYRTVKLVRPFQTTGSDNMGIIELDETGMKDAAGAVTAAAYCARMAGILCGIPMGMSATYAALPELTEVTARSEAEQTQAIDAGKLILIHDGQKAKIARAVNSLTTIPAGAARTGGKSRSWRAWISLPTSCAPPSRTAMWGSTPTPTTTSSCWWPLSWPTFRSWRRPGCSILGEVTVRSTTTGS